MLNTKCIMTSVKKKLVIVGHGACGKTCLLYTFVNGKFPNDYVPTVFDCYLVDMELNGIKIQVELYDTAGQEDYNRLRPLSYPNTDVFLLAFSIISYGTDIVNYIRDRWADEVKMFCPCTPIVLVGLQKDKRTDSDYERYRNNPDYEIITEERGQEIKKKIGAVAYMECSALLNEGVREVFETAIRASLQEREPESGCGNCDLI